jgi:Na+-transporting NADH:ubiquinone oxidoreductase subunit NqrA
MKVKQVYSYQKLNPLSREEIIEKLIQLVYKYEIEPFNPVKNIEFTPEQIAILKELQEF